MHYLASENSNIIIRIILKNEIQLNYYSYSLCFIKHLPANPTPFFDHGKGKPVNMHSKGYSSKICAPYRDFSEIESLKGAFEVVRTER